MEAGQVEVPREVPDAQPVCLRCFEPTKLGVNYCEECGAATGQYTEYLPYVNIAWQVTGYERLLRGVWADPEASLFLRGLRLLAVVALAPVALFVLPWCRWRRSRAE